MLSGLILTAFLMGVGGVPHCAAMCGAPCATAFPRGLPLSSLAGRCVAYAALGAVAATGAGALADWGREIAFLRPFWAMLLAAATALGCFLLFAGRMPARIDEWGQGTYRKARSRLQASVLGRLAPAVRPFLPFMGGMAWAIMPCGLLYAALTVAALAPGAGGGALVMLAFAVPGAFGVWAAPAVLRAVRGTLPRGTPTLRAAGGVADKSIQTVPLIWMNRSGGGPASSLSVAEEASSLFDPQWAVRVSGAMLAGMSGWALYHQLLDQWRAWCA